jgi:hypothetical protein
MAVLDRIDRSNQKFSMWSQSHDRFGGGFLNTDLLRREATNRDHWVCETFTKDRGVNSQ